MANETGLTPEELQTEDLLGQFRPLDAAESRDRLMFRAGRASAGRVHLWQGVSGVFSVLLLCSLMMRSLPPEYSPETVTPQLVSYTPQPEPVAPDARDLDEQAYIHVRHSVLELGLDALPETPRSVTDDRLRYGDAFKRYMSL